jgi:hypothetical protein
MHRLPFVRPLMAFALTVALAGCGAQRNSKGEAKNSQPLAPMIGEPCLVRVFSGNVTYAQLSNPFAPNEETAPKPGLRFIAVGFPIGAKQTLAVDDYEIDIKSDDFRIPFAVGGENPEAPNVFYDPVDFAETVELTKGTEETNGLDRQMDDEPLLVSWGTRASVLLLLYEVPADLKTMTLHHGTRAIQLEPDTGLIDGKPGTGK